MYNVYEYKLLTDSSMSSNIVTDKVKVSRMFNYSVQFSWNPTSSPVGNCYLEVSADGQNWTKYNATELAIPDPDNVNIIDVREPSHNYVRAVYEQTSGDGILSIIFSGKGW